MDVSADVTSRGRYGTQPDGDFTVVSASPAADPHKGMPPSGPGRVPTIDYEVSQPIAESRTPFELSRILGGLVRVLVLAHRTSSVL
jgi:hypothetical protein